MPARGVSYSAGNEQVFSFPLYEMCTISIVSVDGYVGLREMV